MYICIYLVRDCFRVLARGPAATEGFVEAIKTISTVTN